MSRVRLSVVDRGQELSGSGPAEFERLTRLASHGSSDHRGIVMTTSTLAGRCVATTVPPSAQAELRAHLETAFLWVRGQCTDKDVLNARAACFGSVTAIEELTKSAVGNARRHLSSAKETALDAHADHVVDRYAGLAAHFTVSAVCHALDAVTDPSSALHVLEDIQGARAYQAAGLGAARHAAFRNAALGQATWEAERSGGGGADLRAALAVQVFHEYLGGRWRTHADAERIKNDEFIAWALSGRVFSSRGLAQELDKH